VSDFKLIVKSIFRQYDVDFIDNGVAIIEELLSENHIHVIIDEKVADLHQHRMPWLDRVTSLIKIEATEQDKDINTVQKIAETLLRNGITKNDFIVVIGGGIIQDVGAFTANILKRGINWIFLPTTLLAQCDSCIGSKVGINMSNFKNQLGIFWPPTRIIVDIEFLVTLEKLEIVSGIGEILKVHLISGEDDFKNVERDFDKMISDFSVLKNYIYRSLEIKRRIVEKDEFDVDYRHILNYGHTFGHSIEAYTKNAVPHGIGVSIGMEIANYISMKKGYISEAVRKRISSVIRKNIPYEKLDYRDHERLSRILKQDKKFDGHKLSVIICRGIGNIVQEKMPIDEEFLNLIDEYAEMF